MSSAATTPAPARRAAQRIFRRLDSAVGSRARSRVVVVLACVLALEGADLATIGAAAPQLEAAFHISNLRLGLLAAVSTMVGAIGTLPAGALTDRVCRVRLLAVCVGLWGLAMAAGAAAQNYTWLLVTRLALGGVTAAAGPTVASLTGDFFPAAERGRIYGYVLSGELLGAGVGFVISGSLAGASWRLAFLSLAVPAAVLATVIWRALPEPRRGGQSRLQETEGEGGEHVDNGRSESGRSGRGERGSGRGERGSARSAVAAEGVAPVRDQVLKRDPSRLSLRHAVVYVLRIRTNLWLIAASAAGYFFFAGLRTFGLVFVRGHLQMGQASATVILFLAGMGSLAGVLIGGRVADSLIRRGAIDGRIRVAAVAYLAAPALLLPALLFGTLAVAIPFLVLAGAALAAPNPPLDAARLDIMPARLWGRAEGVRTLLRQTAQAGAPLAFGVLADTLGHAAVIASPHHVSQAATQGLRYTFLIMLVPLAVTGVIVWIARRTYPTDVATAIASERAGRR